MSSGTGFIVVAGFMVSLLDLPLVLARVSEPSSSVVTHASFSLEFVRSSHLCLRLTFVCKVHSKLSKHLHGSGSWVAHPPRFCEDP